MLKFRDWTDVNLIDLVNSLLTSICWENRRRYSRKRVFQSSFHLQAMGFNLHRPAQPLLDPHPHRPHLTHRTPLNGRRSVFSCTGSDRSDIEWAEKGHAFASVNNSLISSRWASCDRAARGEDCRALSPKSRSHANPHHYESDDLVSYKFVCCACLQHFHNKQVVPCLSFTQPMVALPRLIGPKSKTKQSRIHT